MVHTKTTEDAEIDISEGSVGYGQDPRGIPPPPPPPHPRGQYWVAASNADWAHERVGSEWSARWGWTP
jgi:hypothetical protein